MTRDEQVALVARIAATSGLEQRVAVEYALQLVEAAEQAVDSKRGTERDWERLEAAAQCVVTRRYDSSVYAWSQAMDELAEALAALQPKERSS